MNDPHKWFDPTTRDGIPGYQIKLPMRVRRHVLAHEIEQRRKTKLKYLGLRRKAAISVMRSLQQIVNINQSIRSNIIMSQDIAWIRRRYRI